MVPIPIELSSFYFRVGRDYGRVRKRMFARSTSPEEVLNATGLSEVTVGKVVPDTTPFP